MNRFSIAIDGPAGAGKSTVAKSVAQRLGILYLDTGAMYRALGLGMLRMGLDLMNGESICQALPKLRLEVAFCNGQRVLLNGEDVTSLIRTPECAQAASQVSAVAQVRRAMVALQQETARGQSVVMDGRDIATDVLPDATLKVFLTASAEERARRRWEEQKQKGQEMPYQEVLAELNRRDLQDTTREASPLRQAEDAVELDSTNLSPDEVIDRILALLREKEGEARG